MWHGGSNFIYSCFSKVLIIKTSRWTRNKRCEAWLGNMHYLFYVEDDFSESVDIGVFKEERGGKGREGEGR